MGKNCAPCCPVIRVKCSTRKVRGKLRCTVKMAGKTWKRTQDKAAAKVRELQARLVKKGCRGDVIGSAGWAQGATSRTKQLRRRAAGPNSVAEHYRQSVQSQPYYSGPSYSAPAPYDPHYEPFDGY